MKSTSMQPRKQQGNKVVSGREQTRTSILGAALKLLQEGGREALTTRAVAELAGVQPPILYRLFIDKEGLLDALAEHGFTLYLAHKQPKQPETDPVEALRSGWDKHVQFGLGHPSLYLLMYARPQEGSGAAAELSSTMLQQHMGYVAAAGRLRIPEERAGAIFHAAAVGVVLTLLRSSDNARDLTLSNVVRDHTLSLIALEDIVQPQQSPISTAATTLAAALNEEHGFSPGEFGLLKEWLGRLKAHSLPARRSGT